MVPSAAWIERVLDCALHDGSCRGDGAADDRRRDRMHFRKCRGVSESQTKPPEHVLAESAAGGVVDGPHVGRGMYAFQLRYLYLDGKERVPRRVPHIRSLQEVEPER